MRRASFLLLTGFPAFALACCGVGPRGVPVVFVGQTNLVVWDAARGVEHFVRDARFGAGKGSLGFIAPTPTQPTLAAVDGRVFETLASLRPQDETASAEAAATKSMPGAVAVIAEQDVAGYHASVLKADDASALARWLKGNGYVAPAFLEEWVRPYVEKGWYLTAFKVTGSATGPVRMSFATDVPFNPYRVPKENSPNGSAPLRLYYLSSGDEVPRIGGREDWREPEWSAPVDTATSAGLARQLHLSLEAMPHDAHVASYLDNDFAQGAQEDLYFVPEGLSAKASMVSGAAATLAALSFLAWRLRRRSISR